MINTTFIEELKNSSTIGLLRVLLAESLSDRTIKIICDRTGFYTFYDQEICTIAFVKISARVCITGVTEFRTRVHRHWFASLRASCTSYHIVRGTMSSQIFLSHLSSLVDWQQISLLISLLSITFNPTAWNIVARNGKIFFSTPTPTMH